MYLNLFVTYVLDSYIFTCGGHGIRERPRLSNTGSAMEKGRVFICSFCELAVMIQRAARLLLQTFSAIHPKGELE